MKVRDSSLEKGRKTFSLALEDKKKLQQVRLLFRKKNGLQTNTISELTHS